MTETEQVVIKKAHDALLLAFDRLYPRRSEPDIANLLARIEASLSEITTLIGDFDTHAFGVGTYGEGKPPEGLMERIADLKNRAKG